MFLGAQPQGPAPFSTCLNMGELSRNTFMKVSELMDSAILRMERITRSLRGDPLDKLESAGMAMMMRLMLDDEFKNNQL